MAVNFQMVVNFKLTTQFNHCGAEVKYILYWASKRLVLSVSSLLLLCVYHVSVTAQTLDQQYLFYLNTKCAGLGFARDSASIILPGQAGPNLFAFCNGPVIPEDPPAGSTVSTNSIGGGSGAVGKGGDGEDAALRRRREQLRDDEQSASTNSGADLNLIAADSLGVFLSVDFQHQRQDVTTYEAGRKADASGLVFGLDYRLGSTAILGLAFSQRSLSGDFVGGGDFDNDSNAMLFYGSWFPQDNFFVDFSLGQENADQNTTRIIGLQRVLTTGSNSSISYDIPLTAVASDSDSKTNSVELRGGYDFLVGELTVGPRLSLAQRKTKADNFVEAGNTPMTLRFNNQTEKSQLGSVGVQASKALGLSVGIVNLQVNLDWLHEFKDDQRTLTANFAEDLRPNPTQLSFLNQAPDRNWFNAQIAMAAVFSGGLSTFVSLENSFGHDYLDQYSVSFGLRKEF